MKNKPITYSTAPRQETAVLVALIGQKQSDRQVREYLDELDFLSETLDYETKYKFTQRLERAEVKTFVGKGKLEEIEAYVKHHSIDAVIFDDDLTPSQLRNLENFLKVKIYDRSLLILDIFLKRAQTAQAKTQVELARYQYILPRLTRMWTHLERQRGGTGTRGGAGEKEIETDKRTIRHQIDLLKDKLKKIEKQGATQRKNRENIVRVALVGYTNVGKSTLMRMLTKADVLAENKLFATVDSTVRKVVYNNIPFLLSDTVGFIRKLPHHLIESFKSTLDEITEADILLHVVDISHPGFEEQIEIVNQTLLDIKAADKPTLLVFNKIDLVPQPAPKTAEEEMEIIDEEEAEHTLDFEALRAHYSKKANQTAVFISAENRDNVEELREVIFQMVKKRHMQIYPNYLEDQVF
nr:GTPase HflX [Penaeicola halotolerans]